MMLSILNMKLSFYFFTCFTIYLLGFFGYFPKSLSHSNCNSARGCQSRESMSQHPVFPPSLPSEGLSKDIFAIYYCIY